MTSSFWVRFAFASLLGGTLFATSCGDVVVQSVKTGLFSFVTGSVNSTFGAGQFNDFLNNLFTGGFTGGTSGTGT